MTNQQRLEEIEKRLEEIEKRLEVLIVLDNKINTIISMLSDKRNNCEPLITFTKANANADDTELKSYEVEFYQMLDKSKEK